MPTFYTSPKVYEKARKALYRATHKKITRKGCKNVQLVWHESEYPDEDGEWMVEKIDPKKPAVFVTKKVGYIHNGLSGETYSFKRIIKHNWEFPHSLMPGE